MIVAPFNDHDVLASLTRQVAHVVIVAARVLHVDLFARSFGPVHTHIENIVTCDQRIGFSVSIRSLN